MKVSELIRDITIVAEKKFGVSDHRNDYITVSISYCDTNTHDKRRRTWEACLRRPTKRALDGGEIEDTGTCRTYEFDTAFHVAGDTMLEVLLALRDDVYAASEWGG